MQYVKVEDGLLVKLGVQRATAEREIRSLYPNVSLPARLPEKMLEDHGFVQVRPAARPDGDVVTEGQPEQRDGKWYQTWEVREFTAEEIEARANTQRDELIGQNNAAYEQAIASLTADYPAAEIQTWERQRAEVIAWEADPTAPTPWIDLAASARGLDRGKYLGRTLAKVHAFARASAWLTGRRQGIDDAIRAATTVEALQAIVVDYTLPGGTA